MNARNRHLINVLSTGVLVAVLALVGLFWARWYLHLVRVIAPHERQARVGISPTGLFPFETADDPNLASPSGATAQLNPTVGLFAGLGAPQYIGSHVWGGNSNIFRWEDEEEGTRLRFDPSLGLMVYGRMSDIRDPNGTTRRKYVTQFAGPEGVANAPDEKLGRFSSPITDWIHIDLQTVYDKAHRCFFAINWRAGLVKKGSELTEEDALRPVQIGGWLQENPLCLNLTARYEVRLAERLPESRQAFYAQLPQMSSYPVSVVNESGRIDLLNPDTLTLTPGVGYLPMPPTLFESSRPIGPADVAAFCVHPVCVYRREAATRWSYVGTVAATASRDLTGVQVVAFDPNGRSVGAASMYPTPDDVYFSLPGASLVTVLQYLLENLYPPASLMLSSLAASHVPATSDFQSLVLVPNSFVAMAGRDADFGRLNRFAFSLFFMLPAIGLGVFLAWRVSRDAVRMGLSRQERTLWTLGAFAMGLPAYITYRLTRPTVALVTCMNCGLGRRADFEKCQRCGSVWTVPELVPPAWRVFGEPEQAEDALPAPAEETGSPTTEA